MKDDTAPCPRCARDVAPWFVEHIEHGGIFDGIIHEHLFRASALSAVTVGCYACTSGWPYPEASETEDEYGERLVEWRLERHRGDR